MKSNKALEIQLAQNETSPYIEEQLKLSLVYDVDGNQKLK